MMKGIVISVFLVVAMVQFMAKPGEAAITCGQVDSALAPCVPYLTHGGTPLAACCAGVTNLKSMTPTTADRQAACSCVKAAAARYPNIKQDAASSLPTKCGVQIGIPISISTDCKSIS